MYYGGIQEQATVCFSSFCLLSHCLSTSSLPFFPLHRMTFSSFFLLTLLLDLQSVDLNWKMTWFSSSASSRLHKNQHASSCEIWARLLLCFSLFSPLAHSLFSLSPLAHFLSYSLSQCCLFLFIRCKGQSSAARLCCQKPLFTKGRNKWLTQTASFIPA